LLGFDRGLAGDPIGLRSLPRAAVQGDDAMPDCTGHILVFCDQLNRRRPAMSANRTHLRVVESSEMRPVAAKGRKANDSYRVREHLTEAEMTKLLAALKRNRHGHRDWLIALLIYRHGLRVSEACDLRWDDIDFTKRTIDVRRLKGSHDSRHYLERDELAALKLLRRQQAEKGIKSAYVFINERGEPFGRMGIARMIERAGEAAELPFPIHVHMAEAFDRLRTGGPRNGY
jgi:integrase